MNYKPRNDMVVVKVVNIGHIDGIAVPDTSIQGKEYHVVAVGPKVEDLERGDVVFMTGQQKVDWDFLPNSTDHLTIREANIICVLEEN